MIISPVSSHYTYNGDSAAFYKYSCNRQLFIYADINIRIKCGGERIYLSVSCAFLRVVQRSCLRPYAGIRMCRTSVVDIATRLRAGRSEVQIQVGPDVQIASRIHPASYSVVTGVFPGSKRPGYAVNDAHLSSAEVRN